MKLNNYYAYNVTISRGIDNITGPGFINFTIKFSENMSADTLPLVSLVFSDGTTVSLTNNNQSYSDNDRDSDVLRSVLVVNATLLRTYADGAVYLNVSRAQDYSGNEMTATARIFNLTYDKTPPYLL